MWLTLPDPLVLGSYGNGNGCNAQLTPPRGAKAALMSGQAASQKPLRRPLIDLSNNQKATNKVEPFARHFSTVRTGTDPIANPKQQQGSGGGALSGTGALVSRLKRELDEKVTKTPEACCVVCCLVGERVGEGCVCISLLPVCPPPRRIGLSPYLLISLSHYLLISSRRPCRRCTQPEKSKCTTGQISQILRFPAFSRLCVNLCEFV